MAETGYSIRQRVKSGELSVDEALAIVKSWVARPAPLRLVRWLQNKKGK